MNGMINAGLLFVLLVICGNAFDRTTPLRNYLIDFSVLASFLIFRIAMRKGRLLFAGIGAIALSFILTILSIISDGSVRSTAVFLLLLIIIVSGVLYKITGIAVSIIACSLAVLFLILAENGGMLPQPDYSVSLLHWFFLTITFGIVGGIVYFSDNITQEAFKLAKEEILERKRIEKDLKLANEELRKRVIEVEKLQEELREQAIRDPLTDLYNRRYMSETLSREILRAEREGDLLSVIIGDIDHFKQINDTHGHQVGDFFLVETAKIFKRHIRGSDFVCRYGGEEFLFVLPGASLEDSERRAEEIRRQLEKLAVSHEEKTLGITMSFGIAAYPVNGTRGDEIIMKADQAMYDAKRMGRNQVRIWGK
jgi:diguanylate cyclase (GGDEF)-like protein